VTRRRGVSHVTSRHLCVTECAQLHSIEYRNRILVSPFGGTPRCGAPPRSRSTHHTVDVPLQCGCCQPDSGVVVWGRSPTLRQESPNPIQGPLRFPTVLCGCFFLSLRCNFVCVHAPRRCCCAAAAAAPRSRVTMTRPPLKSVLAR
jgi:hypothetical protein